MAVINRYVLVDRNDFEQDYEYDSFDEAVAAAGTTHAVIEREYEYSDASLVWTPNGRSTWPPKGQPGHRRLLSR